MCGIFGYVGPKNASDVVLEGLKRLEYSEYDSLWGIAVVSDQICNIKVAALHHRIKRFDNVCQNSYYP